MLLAILFLALPFAIVGIWKKRPIIALIIAAILSYFMLALPGLIQTFQAMAIYGSRDPQLLAGGISHALATAALQMTIILPLLALLQFALRRLRLRGFKKQVREDFE